MNSGRLPGYNSFFLAGSAILRPDRNQRVYGAVRQSPVVPTMSRKIVFFLIAVTLVVILSVGCTQQSPAGNASAETAPGENITMTVPFGPVPVESTNGVNIAYELELNVTGKTTLVPEHLDVIDADTGNVIYTPSAGLLAESFLVAHAPIPPDELVNGSLEPIVPRISVWFVVGNGSVPNRLVHRLTLNRTAEGLSPLTVTGGEVVVRKDLAPVIIGSPLKGAGWTAMETTAPDTHHFLAPITANGVTRTPQRYAQDFFLVDPATGQAVSGNATLSKDYYGYGKEVYAVKNGTVAAVYDGVPDNPVVYRQESLSFETLAGNYVIIDIGDKKYACYGHFIPGSIRVKAGDTVTEGQVIGLVGNSGNSDIPHLHFQIVTGTPSLLGAEGYPHVYRSFTVIGQVNQSRADRAVTAEGLTMDQLWAELGNFIEYNTNPLPQQDRLMENWAVVRFP